MCSSGTEFKLCVRVGLNLNYVSEWDGIQIMCPSRTEFKLCVRVGLNLNYVSEWDWIQIFLGVSCEKSRFYANKSYFFQLRREARKLLGYFVWKITILRQKIIFFPILGGSAPGASPSGSAPAFSIFKLFLHGYIYSRIKLKYIDFIFQVQRQNWWPRIS